jgi:hypothetical protein
MLPSPFEVQSIVSTNQLSLNKEVLVTAKENMMIGKTEFIVHVRVPASRDVAIDALKDCLLVSGWSEEKIRIFAYGLSSIKVELSL